MKQEQFLSWMRQFSNLVLRAIYTDDDSEFSQIRAQLLALIAVLNRGTVITASRRGASDESFLLDEENPFEPSEDPSNGLST